MRIFICLNLEKLICKYVGSSLLTDIVQDPKEPLETKLLDLFDRLHLYCFICWIQDYLDMSCWHIVVSTIFPCQQSSESELLHVHSDLRICVGRNIDPLLLSGAFQDKREGIINLFTPKLYDRTGQAMKTTNLKFEKAISSLGPNILYNSSHPPTLPPQFRSLEAKSIIIFRFLYPNSCTEES